MNFIRQVPVQVKESVKAVYPFTNKPLEYYFAVCHVPEVVNLCTSRVPVFDEKVEYARISKIRFPSLSNVLDV